MGPSQSNLLLHDHQPTYIFANPGISFYIFHNSLGGGVTNFTKNFIRFLMKIPILLQKKISEFTMSP